MIIGRPQQRAQRVLSVRPGIRSGQRPDSWKYVEKVAKENNAEVTVKKFVRFETGEGIEKKVDDFAAEVAAQAGL